MDRWRAHRKVKVSEGKKEMEGRKNIGIEEKKEIKKNRKSRKEMQ